MLNESHYLHNPVVTELTPLWTEAADTPQNVYLYDLMRMGEPCNPITEMMYSHHTSENRDHIVLVNRLDGRRWKIDFNRGQKLTPMEFRLLSAEWRLALIMNKTHRAGQSLMNVLFTIRPDLYNAITNTDRDPFYDNSNIGACMRFICADQEYNQLAPQFKEK